MQVSRQTQMPMSCPYTLVFILVYGLWSSPFGYNLKLLAITGPLEDLQW